MTPFILRGRKKLPPESPAAEGQVYDEHWQLWMDKNSGTPAVSRLRARDGLDQGESAHLQASRFGETTITETREGVDQTEGASVTASQFGETVHTRTREGADQPERTAFVASRLGETTITKTHEGADQPEGTAVPFFDAPYSHF